MTVWRTFLNDKIDDCGVAAACNAIDLWYGDDSVSDDDAKLADDRFGATDYVSKTLWGWWRRGIGKYKLGGFATIKPTQIADAVNRFGCAFVLMSRYHDVNNHVVLPTKVGVESWGDLFATKLNLNDVTKAYAIAKDFHPIFIWWALTNNPRWFLFLAPLWWPQ